MFATPPCSGQRSLAIVVAAEITTCVVNGSFFVKERSCAIDVCPERKRVQSDLLALESGQCLAHVCKGFGGPAHACNVTGEGCARPHLC